MPIIVKTALVPFSAQQLFELVNNVEDYPNFLPWCSSTHVLDQTDQALKATITIQWSGIKKSFTTLNTLEPYTKMDIQLVDGPFHKLEGVWTFQQLNEAGCKVSLNLDFEFTGNIIDSLFQPVFSFIANSLVDSFCKRAKEIYGQR